MKKYLTTCFCLIITILYSQETLKVSYEETFTFTNNRKITFNTTLFANTVISQYIKTIDDKRRLEFGKPMASDDENKMITPKIVNSGNSSTLIIDRAKQTTRQNLLHEGKPVIIDDVTVNLEWQLLNEVKTIKNFKCNKATVNFRGRTFVAWYTLDIPISAGPWKFYGLPGLILEITDTENMYTWYATEIIYPAKEQLVLPDFDYSKFDLITLRAYVESKLENIKAQEKLLISKMSQEQRLESSSIERTGLELIYEWETN